MFEDIGAGIVYSLKNIIPVATSLGKLLNPFNLLGIAIGTKGFSGIVKGLTPFDLVLNYLYPEDRIIKNKLIAIASLKEVNENLRAQGKSILDKVGIIRNIFLKIQWFSPLLQLFARMGINLMFFYSILKPFDKEMQQSVLNYEYMGKKLKDLIPGLTEVIKFISILRLVVVSLTDVMLEFLEGFTGIGVSETETLAQRLGNSVKIVTVMLLGAILNALRVFSIFVRTSGILLNVMAVTFRLLKGLIAGPLLAIPLVLFALTDAILIASRGILKAIKWVVKNSIGFIVGLS